MPGYVAAEPSSSSSRSNWLYLANLSEREAEARLNLTGIGCNGQISNSCIFSLTTANAK